MYRISILAAAVAAAHPTIASAREAGAPGGAEIPTIVVTANPLRSETFDLAAPVSVLGGEALMLRNQNTLGETLSRLPGVSSSYFGPNASRPVIRGMDAGRVRIMQDGVGMQDASALSPDHATTTDPLVIERVEVVRGPATLLYGGSAIGGVVNVLDNRVPREALTGVAGRVETRAGGADRGRGSAALLEAGDGEFALHADASARRTEDLRIPGHARASARRALDGPGETQPYARLPNSAADTDSAALGASMTASKGYLGVAVSDYATRYGTVAEPDVQIDLRSRRWDLAGEARDLAGFVTGVQFKFGDTDYRHAELENGTTGTVFSNRGCEWRVEATHGALGPFKGVVGTQFVRGSFSALGDEALLPRVRTDEKALFALEEAVFGAFKISLGGRLERSRVDSAGGGPPAPNTGLPRFGAGDALSFNTRSGAFGMVYDFAPNFSLAANLAHNERAPSYAELYANGAHIATGQYVLGNRALAKEHANGLDVQLRWRSGQDSASIGVFRNRFRNYVAVFNSGNARGADGELNPADLDGDGIADGSGEDILPEALTRAVAAEFRGVEAEAKFRLIEASGTLDLRLSGDYVRATNRDSGEPLPRIPPLRLGAGLDWRHGRLAASLDVTHARRQDRVAANELPTAAYTLVDAALTWRIDASPVNLDAFLKASNLLDREARVHASVLKDIAPLAGRGVTIGLRGSF